MSQSVKKFDDISEFDEAFSKWSAIVNDSFYALEDVARDIREKIVKLENSFDNIEELNERLDKVNLIYRKYGKTYDEITDYKNRLMERKSEILSRDVIKAKYEDELNLVEMKLEVKSKKLSEIRKRTSSVLMDKIKKELLDLNMTNVCLEVQFSEISYCSTGKDQVDFLVSFNKSESPKPIAKVASGGEVSRFMLALKAVIAATDDIGTLIFDEIDTGVSGISAQKIGTKLKDISYYRQVICITHLPQIASFASAHFVVEKEQKADETSTKITELGRNERISEIAKMMSGMAVTGNTLLTAEDLLVKNSENK